MKKNENIRIVIVESTFQQEISENLEKHCVKTLKENGITESNIVIVKVPGSLEIPLAAKNLAKKNAYDAIIVFGAIHKGETYHFELIANECARGCMDVSLAYEIPVIFEVLAVYDINDAIKRATRQKENRGVEGALTALSMIKTLQEISSL